MSIIVASLTTLTVIIGSLVIVLVTWPRKITEDVMMQVVGDAPHIEGRQEN